MAVASKPEPPIYPSTPSKVVGGAPPKAVSNSKAKPQPKAKVTATKTAPAKATSFDPSNPATWGAGLNSAQLSAIVSSQIGDAVNPQVQDLQQQQKYSDQQATAGEQSIQNYYAALAKAVGGEAPAVSSAYNQAAQTVGQVGQGLTGVAGQQMEAGNAQDQQLLQNAGQTQASGYVQGQANPGGAALNPWFTTNALSPAESLAGTGAAKATAAAAQPGIFANTGADALTSAIQKAVAGDTDFQQKIATIYTQVPALREKILTDVQNYETSQRQLKDTETELGIKDNVAVEGAAEKEQALQATITKNNNTLALGNASIQERAEATAANIAARRQLQVLKAQQTAAGKTGTASVKWSTQAKGILTQAKYMVTHPSTPAQTVGGVVVSPASYGDPQANFNALWSAYVTPYLKSLPANQQATARVTGKAAILNAMRAAGLPIPGKGK